MALLLCMMETVIETVMETAREATVLPTKQRCLPVVMSMQIELDATVKLSMMILAKTQVELANSSVNRTSFNSAFKQDREV